MSADGAADRPLLQVISGDASPEEVAAILAVVAARAPGARTPGSAGPAGPGCDAGAARVEDAGEGGGSASTWAEHSRSLRGRRSRYRTGPDGWRTSFRP